MEFKTLSEVPDGYLLNNFFFNRMIKNNRNVLGATVGKTGSGKSWFNLSLMEMWYARKFKEPFPVDNVCFSVDEVVKRLLSNELRRGEFLILEEGGVNMGSLDFQTKIAKAFNYILQSFRSLNIGLMVNLPYFSMLNKNTRMLMHILIETTSIDRNTNRVIIKPLLLQVDQRGGKEYFHAPKLLINGSMEKIQRETYPRPSEKLVEQYEKRKKAFVLRTVTNFSEMKNKNNEVTETQAQVYYLRKEKGLPHKEIANLMNTSAGSVALLYSKAQKNGLTRDLLPNYKDFYKEFENISVIPPKTHIAK